MIYDGEIILVLEGVDNFHDDDSKNESSLKFWLPKYFPERIRVIITASPGSKSKGYLKSLGCNIITLKADKRMVRSYLKDVSVNSHKYLLGGTEHFDKLKEVVDTKLEDTSVNMIFAKSLFAMFSPRISSETPREKSNLPSILTSIDYKKLHGNILLTSEIDDIEPLIEYAINFYSDRLIKRENLLDFLAAISLTHKGLTEPELIKFSKVTNEELQGILRIFGIYFMCFKGYYICHNEVFRRVVESIYYPQPENKKEMHKRIAYIFEKAPNNVRKLEEEATHFYQAEEFFSLKQIISTIENFLMLFNPITKFDLFRYWRRLEQKGYDPVIEYNKGVEQFDTQYIPEPDRLFVIILQVCRFLKEFSDFETDVTPVFRHPLIKGKIGVKMQQGRNRRTDENGTQSMEKKDGQTSGANASNLNDKKGLARAKNREASLPRLDKGQTSKTSLKKKGILQSETTRKRNRQDPLGTKEPFYDKGNELSEIEDVDDHRDRESETTFNYLEKIGLLKELKQFSLTHDTFSHSQTGKEQTVPNPEHIRWEEKNKVKRRFEEILEEWEDVNVENPAGRERFRSHFLNIFNETVNIKAKPTGNTVEDNDLILAIQNTNKSDLISSQDNLLKVQSSDVEDLDLRHEYQTKIDHIDLEIKPEKDPSFYYYKRWIWIMFPWVCMSISNELNFSEVISKCYSSATKYMKIEEENEFYRSSQYLWKLHLK